MPHYNNRNNRNSRGRQRNHYNNPLPDKIPSPYNFVRLSNFVFLPEWSDKASHDIPFSDGISGTIDIKVTTKTPCYIRNGGNFAEDDIKRTKDDSSHFYNKFFEISPNGYFIPGTTFKGMLRNILEIASFGKMSHIDDKRYSIRDLHFRPYTNSMTNMLGSRKFKSKVKAGWLKQIDEDKWSLYPCDYARVEQEDLEDYHGGNIEIGTQRENSKDKYRKWYSSKEIECTIDKYEKEYPHSCGKLIYKKVTDLGSGKDKGTLVFTGQAMPRYKRNAKHMEFIFFNKTSKTFDVSCLKKDFEFIHADSQDKNKPNKEWGFWKNELENKKEMPVFYLEKQESDEPESIGLAMMYRLAYKHTIKGAIENTTKKHFCKQADLAETIFGYTHEDNSLKGRVHIGHLCCQNNPESLEEVLTVLGSPKPTYYPNYIRQKIDSKGNITTNNYNTLLEESSEIRGWKRYIIRKDNSSPIPNSPPVIHGRTNLDVATSFNPVPENTIFKGKIRVHNLRPEELGALVWSLTWGGKENLRHSIGMAKPYGYGSIEIKIEKSSLKNMHDQVIDINDTQKDFIALMQEVTKNKIDNIWGNSIQIKQLLAMADPNYNHPHKLEYIQLKMGRDNQFVGFKKAKKALLEYET